MFILPLYFCICFLLTKETFASFLPFTKRQAIPSRICGEQNNTVAICSPSTDSIWYNHTENEVIWKYNNPKFGQYTTLDLYLLYINSTTDYYDTIKSWTGLSKSAGTTVVEVDDTWFPAEFGNNTNVTLTAFMYLVGSGYDIYSDLQLIPTEHNFFPAPLPFTIIRVAPNTTSPTLPSVTSASPTATETTPTSDETDDNQSKKLAGWAIAVIVIAIILFLLALVALIWAYKRYKNKKQLNADVSRSAGHGDDEKIPVLTSNKNDSNIILPVAGAALAKGDIASINSSTQQLWSPRSLSPRHDEISFITTSEKPGQHQPQPLGLHSEANQSSSILSSTDALMIADTFRQFMRKPDWNEELELNEQNKTSKKEDN